MAEARLKISTEFSRWYLMKKDSTSFPFLFFAIIRQRISIVSSISLDPSSCKSEPSLKKLDLDAVQDLGRKEYILQLKREKGNEDRKQTAPSLLWCFQN